MNKLEKNVKQYEIPVLISILLINLLLVGIFGLYKYTKALKSKYEYLGEMRQVKTRLEDKLELINQTKADINNYNKELEALDASLPAGEATEYLIPDLIRQAAKTGHRLERFNPQQKNPEQNYFEARIDFVGLEENTGELIRNIESVPRLLEITKLTLSTNKQDENVTSMSVKIYTLKGKNK